jgi:serine protease Do
MRARIFRAAVVLAGVVPMVSAQQPEPQPRAHTRGVFVRPAGGSYLGVGVSDIDAERAKALKLKEESGVEIKSVDSDSPAEKAGLKVGDVVMEYNGQKVQGYEQFARLVRETPADRLAHLKVVRQGSTLHLTATIGTRPGGAFVRSGDGFTFVMPAMPKIPDIKIPPMPPMPPMPDLPHSRLSWRSAALGIESEALNPQLAEFFGVKEGVLVRSVGQGTPAEKAGIKAGDVIVQVNGTKITSPHEISNAVRSAARSKKPLAVTLVREKREMSVTVELKESDGWGGVRSRNLEWRRPAAGERTTFL